MPKKEERQKIAHSQTTDTEFASEFEGDDEATRSVMDAVQQMYSQIGTVPDRKQPQ